MRMTAVLTALLFVQVVVVVRLELCAGTTTTTTTALAMWVPTPKRSLVRPPTSRGSSSSLWAIVPLQAQELENLVTAGGPNGSVLTASPTREQYLTYFGRTPSERYARLVESLLISLLGMTFSYFLSFVLGGYVATLLGSLFLFWSVLVPDFKARQRNWEFLMGRSFQDYYYDCDDDNEEERDLSYDENSNALYGALWTGYIADVCVVESSSATQEYDLQEFQDYTMERDDLEKYTGQPYLLRTQVQDHQGRVLQIHARLSEDYLGLAPRMPVLGILLSHNRQFTQLDALTDLYVPSCQCWIGDYPYLNRYEIQALLEEDDRIWNQLQKEGLPQEKHEKSDL